MQKKGGGKKVMHGLESRLIGRPGITPFLRHLKLLEKLHTFRRAKEGRW
jgi:hypothetical protein